MSKNLFKQEVENKKRFEFGKNWESFLKKLDDDRIKNAEKNLKDMLQVNDLSGKSFLDIGCGSGLSSLAAKKFRSKSSLI